MFCRSYCRINRLFCVLGLFLCSLGIDESVNINRYDISICVCTLSCTSLALFVDEKLLDAQADLVAVFVEVNDLSGDFLSGLENI